MWVWCCWLMQNRYSLSSERAHTMAWCGIQSHLPTCNSVCKVLLGAMEPRKCRYKVQSFRVALQAGQFRELEKRVGSCWFAIWYMCCRWVPSPVAILEMKITCVHKRQQLKLARSLSEGSNPWTKTSIRCLSSCRCSSTCMVGFILR